MSHPPPDLDTSADEYFLEIESHFARLRETTFLFSAKDWALMKSWHEEGIPLAVVLEAIDGCFSKRRDSGRRQTISSLAYCRHAVVELWSERKDLYVGKGESLPEEQPADLLKRLAEELRESASLASSAVGNVLETAAVEVEGASAIRSVPAIEEALLEIEQRLLEASLAAMSADDRAAIDRETDDLLRGLRADEPAYARTRAANRKRLIRARFNLPRLSLFR